MRLRDVKILAGKLGTEVVWVLACLRVLQADV
jgi:hypothetical protein